MRFSFIIQVILSAFICQLTGAMNLLEEDMITQRKEVAAHNEALEPRFGPGDGSSSVHSDRPASAAPEVDRDQIKEYSKSPWDDHDDEPQGTPLHLRSAQIQKFGDQDGYLRADGKHGYIDTDGTHRSVEVPEVVGTPSQWEKARGNPIPSDVQRSWDELLGRQDQSGSDEPLPLANADEQGSRNSMVKKMSKLVPPLIVAILTAGLFTPCDTHINVACY